MTFPSDADVNLEPPDAAEAALIARGLATATAGPEGLTEVQRVLIDELVAAMTGHRVSVADLPPLDAAGLAQALARRDRQFRTRGVQLMVLLQLILVPLPADVADRVDEYAAALGIDDEEMLGVARRVARGALGLALVDFERSGYFEGLVGPQQQLHTDALAEAWEARCDDPALAQQWAELEHCPDGSLGQGVWRFYRARGFSYPGLPQSAPPTLAQHDWIHVLADYGSTVESEIEIFGFIARANDDPRAFALLAMVIGLFETGYLHAAAKGFFAYDRGHLSRDAPRMAVRLADAMRRGALCGWHMTPRREDGRSVDLMTVDWFQYADRPLTEVREEFAVVPKSEQAVAAGSVTPWELGGISPFQHRQGQDVAAAAGVPYDSFGASP